MRHWIEKESRFMSRWYSEAEIQRFEKYFKKTDGCWIWEGGRSLAHGKYPRAAFHPSSKRTTSEYASRSSYRLYVGPISKGMFVCHKCDNGMCVNPDHLFIGTVKDNQRDMVNKGRSRRGRDNNSKLTPEQVLEIRSIPKYTRGTHTKYGVSPVTVSVIRSRQSWAWL